MYEELVKRLREESEIERWLQPHSANETPKLLNDAADAIEELSRRIERAVDLYNRNVEKTAIYEALIGLSPEPPKEDT